MSPGAGRRVQVAVREALGGQHLADDDHGGPEDAGRADLGGDVGQRAAQDRPRRRGWRGPPPRPDSRRRSSATQLARPAARCAATARCSTIVARLAPSVARSSPAASRSPGAGDPGQDHRLPDPGHGQLALERRRRGRERRYAGRHVVGHPGRVQAAHLLGHRAEHRRVAGVQPRDVQAGLGAPRPARRRSRPASAAAVSTCGRPAGSTSSSSTGTSAPAYRQTGEAAIRSRPRTVIRSAAPGPAPMKWTVTWSTLHDRHGHCGRQPVIPPTGDARVDRRAGPGRRRARRTTGRPRASVSSVTRVDHQPAAGLERLPAASRPRPGSVARRRRRSRPALPGPRAPPAPRRSRPSGPRRRARPRCGRSARRDPASCSIATARQLG